MSSISLKTLRPRISEKERLGEIRRLFEFESKTLINNASIFSELLSKRCTICINSEKYGAIDSFGRCPDCQVFFQKKIPKIIAETKQKSETKFREYVKAHIGIGEKYDALVLVSGGKDSVYMLYRIHCEYPDLRILAITVNNHFTSNLSYKTAERVCHHLGIDHRSLFLDPEVTFPAYRYGFYINFGPQDYPLSDEIDGTFIFDCARHFAATHKIPLIFIGLSTAQLEPLGYPFGVFESNHHEESKPREAIDGHPIHEILAKSKISAKSPPTFWDPNLYSQIPSILYPFNAWGYNKEIVWHDAAEVQRDHFHRVLEEEGIDSEFISSKAALHLFVSNSDLFPLIFQQDFIKLGYSRFELEFSDLIRQGQLKRETLLHFFQAAEILAPAYLLTPKTVKYAAQRLGLSGSEFLLLPSEEIIERRFLLTSYISKEDFHD